MPRWVQAHRRRGDARPWQLVDTCWTQAVLVLRWFKDSTDLRLLARDGCISVATAYRYLHEAIDVIAAHAPELPDLPTAGREAGWTYVCFDGTLIESTRTVARSAAGHDVWYSGKHHTHGGNIQVLTDPTGYRVWTSPVEPRSVHDITAAGIGIHVPTRGKNLAPDNRTRNYAINTLRAPAERANVLLKTTFKTLRRITDVPHTNRPHRRRRTHHPHHATRPLIRKPHWSLWGQRGCRRPTACRPTADL